MTRWLKQEPFCEHGRTRPHDWCWPDPVIVEPVEPDYDAALNMYDLAVFGWQASDIVHKHVKDIVDAALHDRVVLPDKEDS